MPTCRSRHPLVGEERAARLVLGQGPAQCHAGYDSEHMFVIQRVGVSTKRTRSGSNLGPTVVTKTRGGAADAPGRTYHQEADRHGAKRSQPPAAAAVLARPGPRPVGRRAHHARRPAGPGPVGQAARPDRPRRRHRPGAPRRLGPRPAPAGGLRRRRRAAARSARPATTTRDEEHEGADPWRLAVGTVLGLLGVCGLAELAKGVRRVLRLARSAATRAATWAGSSAARSTPASARPAPPSCSSPWSSWPSWWRPASRWPRWAGLCGAAVTATRAHRRGAVAGQAVRDHLRTSGPMLPLPRPPRPARAPFDAEDDPDAAEDTVDEADRTSTSPSIPSPNRRRS